MKYNIIEKISLKDNLDSVMKIKQDGTRYWSARDIYPLLGYKRWESFINIFEKSKNACKNSGNCILDHFRDTTKKVNLGVGTQREVEDYELTRLACYLIAQNGDPKKKK